MDDQQTSATPGEKAVSLAGASASPDRIPFVPGRDGRRIFIATSWGYCAGVDHAADAVEKALEPYGTPVYARKEIVHNKYVVETLSRRGAIFVSEAEEVLEGAQVVSSVHGVLPAVHAEVVARSPQMIDATYLLVTEVHKQAARLVKDDYDILFIGHTGHKEAEGTQGEAPEHIQVVNGPEKVDGIEVRDPDKVVWISQTTLSVDETFKTVRRLCERFPNLVDPPSDDICYATQNHQDAVKAMTPEYDAVIVIGSANSSNFMRLVEVALEAGVGKTYRVDCVEEVRDEWLEGVQTVGLTFGVSVPEILVRDVVERLAEIGFTQVDPVQTASGDIRFPLPKNLRADPKAAGVQPDCFHKVHEHAGRVRGRTGRTDVLQ